MLHCQSPYGYNIAEGGQNARFPEERARISKALTGRKDPEEVKARKSAAQKKRYAEDPTACQKQSEGLKKRFSDPNERKKQSVKLKKYKAEHPVSDETRRLISATKVKYRKKVRCVETGEIFESVSAATKFFNAEPTQISRVCRGVRKTYHGYHFEFVKD